MFLLRKCQYQGTEYNVGDHVLISNSEADDPESVKHCYVASIVYMYEMSESFLLCFHGFKSLKRVFPYT